MKISLISKTKNNKKIRSTLNWLIVIALVAIVAANYIVWKNYFGEQTQIELVKNEIIQVNQQISQAEPPPSNLKSKLQKAQDDLVAAHQVFPQDVDRTDVVDFILKTAEACDVQIVPLVFEGWETGEFGQAYKVLKYSGTVIGTLAHATDFITMLHNGNYPTIMFARCSVTRTTGLDISVPADDIGVTIDLVITLYTSSIQAEDAAS